MEVTTFPTSRGFPPGWKPLYSWAEGLEATALDQARNLCSLPFAFHHVALMPDAHMGYGMPIGGVFASDGVVIPNAVGVDIGCGVSLVRTSMTHSEWDAHGPAIMESIVERVPVGFNHHDDPQDQWLGTALAGLDENNTPITFRELAKSLLSIGTLGGGNHFIEAQYGHDDRVWFMLHSGSRNLGKQICDHYNKVAQDLNAKWHSEVEKKKELAFLPISTIPGAMYMAEQKMALLFARENRSRIATAIEGALAEEGYTHEGLYLDVHHNYAQWEHHFGRNVIVHRKGAVRAVWNEPVIIPGTMGTRSYLALGTGDEKSFTSCSHGAGRCMGRRKARENADVRRSYARMALEGIELYSDGDPIDEAPGAYKDIDRVMELQDDLVMPYHILYPIAVIKA